MSESLKGPGAITLFVEDLQRSRSFCRDVFGLQLIHEDEVSAAFDFENTTSRFPRHALLSSPEPVADREAGSRFQLTIWVDDADAACAELKARGVALFNGPMDRKWGCVRLASPILPATSGRSLRSCPAPSARGGRPGPASQLR